MSKGNMKWLCKTRLSVESSDLTRERTSGILFVIYFGGLVFGNIGFTAPFVMMGILNFVLLGIAAMVHFQGRGG